MSEGELCNNPVLSVDISTGITFRVPQLFLECYFTSSKETMPSFNAMSRNCESICCSWQQNSLEERDYYQAVAKIEGVCCVWFNGNVRTLPKIRSCSDTVSAEAVAKTEACLLSQFVAFWERYERMYKWCLRKLCPVSAPLLEASDASPEHPPSLFLPHHSELYILFLGIPLPLVVPLREEKYGLGGVRRSDKCSKAHTLCCPAQDLGAFRSTSKRKAAPKAVQFWAVQEHSHRKAPSAIQAGQKNGHL